MKRIVFVLTAMTLLVSSCFKKEKQTDSVPDKSGGYQVTFIELGSVNCVPCKMMQPIMADIEKEFSGKVKVVFYDVWTAGGRPYGQYYGIRAIPTQIFLDKDGKEYYRHEGYFPKEDLIRVLRAQGVR